RASSPPECFAPPGSGSRRSGPSVRESRDRPLRPRPGTALRARRTRAKGGQAPPRRERPAPAPRQVPRCLFGGRSWGGILAPLGRWRLVPCLRRDYHHCLMDIAIRCRDLRKVYDGKPPVEALRGLDLEVRAGECFGILGPNGAGKTTTVEILEGILRASGGDVEVMGLRWGRDDRALRERIGVSLQET